jgi:uncharacterized protein (TIGR00730 family)
MAKNTKVAVPAVAVPKEAAPLTIINKPEAKVARDPHTHEDILSGTKHHNRTSRIASEFERGLQFIRRYEKSVTIYGSARFKPNNVHYKDARALAARFAKEGYAVVTGGGPGIMEAGNRGAREAGGASIGLNIELPFEQIINPYVTDSMSFYYFFSRKTTMSFASEAYIYYPGGFGTLDELFEILTLIQTGKIRKIPIFLVGSDFWAPLEEFIENVIMRDHGAIDKKDLQLYTVTDDHDLIIKTVLAAPVYK